MLTKDIKGVINAAKWAGSQLVGVGGFKDETILNVIDYKSVIWVWSLDNNNGLVTNLDDFEPISVSYSDTK